MRISKEIKAFYKDFLDDLCDKGLADFFTSPSRERIDDWIDSPDCCINTAGGETKVVLWEDTLPYVLKIPCTYSKNCLDTDFCKKEVENYNAACDEDVDDKFAAIDFLFNFRNYPIYIMEKAECDADRIYDSAYSSALRNHLGDENVDEMTLDEREELEEGFSCDFDSWDSEDQMDSLLYDIWDYEEVDRFKNFCIDHEINDLHCGNYGYINNKLVAVDYSGFF